MATVRLDDGRTLIIFSGDDRTLRRWDAASGQPVGDPLIGHTAWVLAVATVRLDDGRNLIISGDGDGTLRRWDAASGQPVGEPLTGHTGPVLAVATARLDDGQTLIISGSNDGTLRRWDAASGQPIGDPLTGHAGWVWAVATARLDDGRTLIFSGSLDGTLRRWDAASGRPVGDPLTGHTDWVLAVATVRLDDGRILIISGGDGTLRRWDAASGQPVRDPLTGHTGPVRAVATARLNEELTLIISGSNDGTLRRWDTASGRPVGDSLTGHTKSVGAVASVRLDDGRTLIISGGDRTLRRWDAASGQPVGDPLTGHTGQVWAVATARLDGGRVLIISGSPDGTLRRWDAASGQSVGDPLTVHTGSVWAVATARLDDGRTLIISGSDDWILILWPLRSNGQIANEPTLTPRVRALSVVDDETVGDALNRGVLAAHLEGLLVQLTTKQRAGTAVVHVDGRWGVGKSTLVNLLIDRLGSSQPQQPADKPVKEWLNDPVVVRYDAWRESTVAPEWWSLARSINMAVRSQRALATRVAMTVTGAVTRLARSRPVLVAGTVLVAMLAAWASGVWKGDIGTVGKVLTTAVTVATLGLALGRVLFWASPAFGQLHQCADDNPLGEIATTVASLRRWSPRGIRGHRVADTLFALIISATVTGYLLAVLQDRTLLPSALTEPRWIAAHGIGLGAAAVAALLVAGCWQRAPQRPAAEHVAARPQPTKQRSRSAPRTVRLVLVTMAAAGAYVAFSPGLATGWLPPLRAISRDPSGWAVAVVLGCVALYLAWTALRRHQPRRPVLLIIDDLDRCSAERVVKLMETVHTLLREPAETRLLPGWRRPAPLIVLVLADGRWVRTAFETSYESFGTLGSPVHGLGADFLQKVFDHTVLVPALAADQVQTYVDQLTDTSPWATAGRAVINQRPEPHSPQALSPPGQPAVETNGHAPVSRGGVEEPEPPPAPATVTAPEPAAAAPEPTSVAAGPTPADSATQRAEHLIADAAPGEVHSHSVRAALDNTTGTQRQRLAEAIAAKAATPEAVSAFSEDLLTRYTPLMPANPRLVKRVANAFGMLLALGLHLDHHEDEDTIARAAIMLVRFPTLVDDLLSAPDPPVLDLPADASPSDPASSWLRRDVQQVLRRGDGSPIDIIGIARCYGRSYAPDPASPSPGTPTRFSPTAGPAIAPGHGSTVDGMRMKMG